MKLKDIIALFAKNKILSLIMVAVFIFILVSYIRQVKEDYYIDGVSNGLEKVEAVGPITKRIELDQGRAWNKDLREKYWFTSQGSGIIPYTWFVWLEQSDNNSLFRSSEFMDKMGYLPSPTSDLNPGGLPIGFTAQRAREDKEPWMGFNCAACHTNQIDFNGVSLMIEGAPTLANFDLTYSELVKSLKVTKSNPEKFKRFATKVLGEGYSEDDGFDLKDKMGRLITKAENRLAVNALPSSEFPENFSGHGRVDAFGQIANSATALSQNALSNNNPPSAPVSYPFLWGTHQSNVVQWNASAPNIPVVGPLIRNVGEVVGVFGDMSIVEAPWWQQLLGIPVAYSSTVDFQGIGDIETWIKELKSPQWPETILPKLDQPKINQGAVIYDRECKSCHEVVVRADEFKNYTAEKTPLHSVGTDPMMAFNAGRGMAQTLLLDGTKESVVLGKSFGATSGVSTILVNGILGLVLKRPKKALAAGRAPESVGDDKSQLKDYLGDLLKKKIEHANEYVEPHDSLKAPNPLGPNGQVLNLDSLVYKARPLNGIWATAPYLHNGSVPSLWELMKSPSERMTSFKVGNRKFDAVNVGFVTDVGPSQFNVLKSDNTIMPGNSNLGHDYGTGLSDDDKWALVEYMKSL